MEYQNIYNILFIIVLLIIIYKISNLNSENFTNISKQDLEGIQNISSMYKNGELKIAKLHVTDNAQFDKNITATEKIMSKNITASEKIMSKNITASEKITSKNLNAENVKVTNSITPTYTSLPTFTSGQIGYTIQKVLSTENRFITGIRNVPTGSDTLNVPIGVYLVNHTFQLNVIRNLTTRKNVTLVAVSGMSIIDYSVGYGDMGMAGAQEYYYNHIPYIVRVTNASNSVRVQVKGIGAYLRLQTSRLTFLRIA